MIVKMTGFLAAALLISGAAQSQEDPGPSALLGDWRSQCDAWGSPAVCGLDWRPGLHGDHITVDYRIRNAETGAMIFEGRGVYDLSDPDRPSGYWSDSGGAIHPLAARWEDGALTTHWGVAGGVLGRTRYVLEPDGALEVTDWQLRDAGWAQFMSARYQRSEPDPDGP